MSITTLEIGDAVNEIINQPTPILFLDTCTLLDVIRLPFRQKNSTTAKAYFDSVRRAVKAIQDVELKVIILPLILKEFKDNLQSTKNELGRHIKELSLHLEILSSLHSSIPDELVVPDLFSLKTESFLEKTCNDLIALSIHVKQIDGPTLRANNRVVMNTPPSRKGAVKDCIIYEHCLEMATMLRKNGFAEKMVFFTTNTEDFCENRTTAKQPIFAELTSLDIGLCLNWSWAISEVLRA